MFRNRGLHGLAAALVLLFADTASVARADEIAKPNAALDVYARPGEMVDIGAGRRLNLRCQGKGSPSRARPVARMTTAAPSSSKMTKAASAGELVAGAAAAAQGPIDTWAAMLRSANRGMGAESLAGAERGKTAVRKHRMFRNGSTRNVEQHETGRLSVAGLRATA